MDEEIGREKKGCRREPNVDKILSCSVSFLSLGVTLGWDSLKSPCTIAYFLNDEWWCSFQRSLFSYQHNLIIALFPMVFQLLAQFCLRGPTVSKINQNVVKEQISESFTLFFEAKMKNIHFTCFLIVKICYNKLNIFGFLTPWFAWQTISCHFGHFWLFSDIL